MSALPEPIEPEPRRDPFGGHPKGDDPRRCKANKSDGSGERCSRWAVAGGSVCPSHGGGAPQARRTAQLRLLDMIPLATKRHREILRNSKDERVVLQATKMVYDRVGLEEGSASADVGVVREMVASKLIDMLAGVYSPDGEDDDEEDIVDAEVVEDPEGWDLL